jgi:decaprenylphospho-beta-D-ribofuranose 2-oxidase
VAGFNELYFRRSPRTPRERVEALHSFFFPLDGVEGWNRLYGWRGLLQYQFVVPFGAEDALRNALELLSGRGAPAFLAVLKRFGADQGTQALGPTLSFPIGGWTLALDLPADASLVGVLDSLDELVAEAGGRVYLAKDSRLQPELLERMYPQLSDWQRVRARMDPAGTMRSDLARRLALTRAAGPGSEDPSER